MTPQAQHIRKDLASESQLAYLQNQVLVLVPLTTSLGRHSFKDLRGTECEMLKQPCLQDQPASPSHRQGPLNPKLSPSSAPLHLPAAWPLPHRADTRILGTPGSLSETLPSSQSHPLKNSQSGLSQKNLLVVSHIERKLKGLAIGVEVGGAER